MKIKTNVMRILDSKKIKYNSYSYDSSKALSGKEVAGYLKQDPNKVFKTLVTISPSKEIYVFMVPVLENLDLKKASKTVGKKSLEMLKSKDLLSTVGYIHGGCSPIGMKKNFPTTIDIKSNSCDTIIFSGGKVGFQVEVTLEDLKKVIDINISDICI